jgi:hypothetical protein
LFSARRRRRIVRKAWLAGAAACLALTGHARAQQASLFTGSFLNTQVQYYTVVDKAPIMAPVPNYQQSRRAGVFQRVVQQLGSVFNLTPTIGSNPVASVATPTLSSPVTQSTFQPSAPFQNGQ